MQRYLPTWNQPNTFLPSWTALMLVSAMIGCSSRAEQQDRGLITLDGQPLVDALIFFQREGDEMATAMGNTNQAGEVFMYRVSNLKAIPPDTYKVVITPMQGANFHGQPEAGPVIPKIYRDASTTPLSIEVPVGKKYTLPLFSQ
ncbi:MAG: hypothetical protein CMJ81_24405 [Planctomycetaceae bacterium]|nr:hypothetical protein [Planctomycetaceae bacterium]MBP60698.1 hypothetical protein [Planctomycetaceae bacterium]